ncbi:unnamed protein product [Ambrosiozyma monospora]|uniref:Unnamed protein product n=1 Tax=Ambrosiozyma monospora TaxID=43982 RepID=A0ACB5SXH5_AMBMO|nr:unnamed protein product [Ambrosiozyma monospora]
MEEDDYAFSDHESMHHSDEGEEAEDTTDMDTQALDTYNGPIDEDKEGDDINNDMDNREPGSPSDLVPLSREQLFAATKATSFLQHEPEHLILSDVKELYFILENVEWFLYYPIGN